MTILQRRRRKQGGKRRPSWDVSRWDVRQEWIKGFGPRYAARLTAMWYPGRGTPRTSNPNA